MREDIELMGVPQSPPPHYGESWSVQQFLAVVMSEGNQDLSRKSSDCKIYVVLNRNIEMKITTDRLYLSNNR